MSNPVAAQRAFLLVLFFVGLGFCQPMHVYPLVNFIEELVVALGVLAAAGYMFWSVREIRLSVWQLLWVALGGLFALSAALHPAPFVSYKLMIGTFWLIGLLALVLGDQLDWEKDGSRLSHMLAVALLVISLVCALGGFMRFYGLLGETWRAYVPEPNNGRMTGLVGHSNFFAFISLFGLLAAGWLFNAKRIGLGLCVFSVLVLVAALIATGSRGVLVAWVAVIAVLLVRRTVTQVTPWLLFMVASFVFYWLFKPLFFAFDHWFYALVLKQGWVAGAGTSGSDVVVRGAVSGQRLDEWKVAFELIRQNFWTGVGIGNYGVSSYEQHLRGGMPSPDGLFTHSHNSPMQLIVELGVAGVAWVIALLVLAGRAFWRASEDQGRLLPILIVMVIQLYGMVEFPMWMMHFLVLNMLLLSALGGAAITGKLKLGKLFTVLAVAGVLMISLIYMPMAERFVWSYRQSFIRAEVDRSEYKFLDLAMRDPLLEPYGYLTYLVNFNMSPGSIATEKQALRRLEEYLPFPQVLVRSALVSMVEGDEDRAQKTIANMRAFYGAPSENVLMSQIAANQPSFPDAHFERLLFTDPSRDQAVDSPMK
jgi:O-antigen ligase